MMKFGRDKASYIRVRRFIATEFSDVLWQRDRAYECSASDDLEATNTNKYDQSLVGTPAFSSSHVINSSCL